MFSKLTCRPPGSCHRSSKLLALNNSQSLCVCGIFPGMVPWQASPCKSSDVFEIYRMQTFCFCVKRSKFTHLCLCVWDFGGIFHPSLSVLPARAELPWSGLERWHLRASKTDGDPPANSSSFQPIIASQRPGTPLLKPPPFATSERKTALPSSLLAFQRFSQRKSSVASVCWVGGGGRGANT